MQKKTIGVYLPSWLARSEKSDALFFKELLRTLRYSTEYRIKSFDLTRLSLVSGAHAKAFCEKHGLVAFLEHDSFFYGNNQTYRHVRVLLEPYVRFFNPLRSHLIGHDKQKTKELLRHRNVPVLPDIVTNSSSEFLASLDEDSWYVIKPTNQGAGTGVKLVKKQNTRMFHYVDGYWKEIAVADTQQGIHITRMSSKSFLPQRSHTYNPVLVEPYFNDDPDGFSSIRCTVVGDKVVESVKRINASNIASNIFRGGIATPMQLTSEQEHLAVSAKNIIGADYAGVDLLCAGGKTVVGEVNIGPFTVFGLYTGVPVGKILAEYILDICKTSAT